MILDYIFPAFRDELEKAAHEKRAMRALPPGFLKNLARGGRSGAKAKPPPMSLLGKNGLDMSPGWDTTYEQINAARAAGKYPLKKVAGILGGKPGKALLAAALKTPRTSPSAAAVAADVLKEYRRRGLVNPVANLRDRVRLKSGLPSERLAQLTAMFERRR